MHVGHHECPYCGAHYAATHFNGCRFAGLDPQDIAAPVAPVARGWFDEHIIALTRNCRAYGINGEGAYYVLKGSPCNDLQVHRHGRAGVHR